MKILNKKRFLCCFSIVFLVTTIIFFADSSLCLRKSMHYSDFEYHIESVVSYVIHGYLSLQILNIRGVIYFSDFLQSTLFTGRLQQLYYLSLSCPHTRNSPLWVRCLLFGQMIKPLYPGIWDDMNCSWLFYMDGLSTTYWKRWPFIYIGKVFAIKKRPLNSIRKHGKLQRHGNFARIQSSSVCSL